MRTFALLILIGLAACQNPSGNNANSSSSNDTIQTASGLRYYYIKKGDGRKVENGSKLKTKLSLMVDDSVVWTSYESEDSIFWFITGTSSVIKGFEEMALLMREGDNVCAILPDSLAYGDKGAGDVIPPNATLVYDRYEMVSVSEPKKILSDTLFPILENGSVDQMLDAYMAIANSSLEGTFHMEEKRSLYQKILKSERFEDLEKVALKFEEMATTNDDKEGAWYYQITAIEKQGDTARYISRLKEIIELDPEESYWKETLEKINNTEE